MRMCNIQEFITAKLISISISQTQPTGPAVDSGKIEKLSRGPRPFLQLNFMQFS